MIKNNNVKIMGVFASVLLLVILITASFAYFGSFNVSLNNNVAVNVNSVSPGDATFTSNATQLNLQVPAANMSQTAADNSTAATSNTATLTVNLTGAANLLTTCTYDIVYEYDDGSNIYGGSQTKSVSKNGDKEITLQVSGVTGTNNFANEKNFDYDSSWSGLKRTLVSGATIESDGSLTTQNISIIGKYYNLTVSQSSLEGKAFTGKIYVTNHSCSTSEPAYITLLNAYGGKDSITELPDSTFLKVTTASEKGMYKKADDLGTSYYYRGAVNNNWVKFGEEQIAICTYNNEQVNIGTYNNGSERIEIVSNIKTQSECGGSGICISSGFGPVIGVTSSDCSNANGTWVNSSPTYGGLKEVPIFWRIIRINGDGSIRMIYSGTTKPSDNSSVTGSNGVYMTGTGTQINAITYKFNRYRDKAEYVGYMYTEGVQHGNSTSSIIKQQVDKWYAGTTLEKDAATKALVSQDQIFCNDRSASSTQSGAWTSTGANYYYGAYGRLTQSTKSPQLTCPEESDKFTSKESSIGNKALEYSVGLITADEVAMAGGVYGSNSTNSSYYLYTNQDYWTGSPYEFYSNGFAEGFSVNSSNSLYFTFANLTFGVRPVISLASKVKLSGNGTYSKPYTVS